VTGLDRRRQRALEALLNAASVARASEACGVSKRAIFNYLREPSFQAALRTARAQSLAMATGLLATASGAAVVRLTELAMGDEPGYALAASRALLDHARPYAEMTDVLDRLSDLEEHTSGLRGSARICAVSRRPPA
jgi:hypothetical protein